MVMNQTEVRIARTGGGLEFYSLNTRVEQGKREKTGWRYLYEAEWWFPQPLIVHPETAPLSEK